MKKQLFKEVLRMKEGTGANSYAKACYITKQILLLTTSMKEKAMKELYRTNCQPNTALCIADLGCSSSEETSLNVMSDLILTANKARRELGHGPKDYQIYLNDLPGNDFNTLFESVASFEDKLKGRIKDDFENCFIYGAPGSFYGRLFPTNSMHFVHSSTSLHWLSQVPEGIDENKRTIYMANTSSPNVLKAYYKQFKKDFLMFLKCRSKEVVVGGKMVLSLMGRRNNDQNYSKEASYMWDLLTRVLNDMAYEGYIEEEKLNAFNLPLYAPSPSELDNLIKQEGSFTLNKDHVFHVSWDANDYTNSGCGSLFNTYQHYDYATCIRSVVEPLMTSHFGEVIIEEVFKRYKEIVNHSMAREKNVMTNVIVTLTRND